VQTDPENAADANKRSALSAIALEMSSMDEDENVEDSAEVKFEIPAVRAIVDFNVILFD
jgi:hypothetical protein